MVFVLLILSLFRGDGKGPSFIGVNKCSAVDWIILVILLIAVIIFTLIAIFCLLKP